MNNSESYAMKTARQLFIVMVMSLPWLTAYANDTQFHKPPLSLPFEVQKAGNKVEAKLEVVEHRLYVLQLRLMYKEGDQKDRARVRKLAGDYEMDKSGKLIEPGVSIQLRFQIYSIEAGEERTLLEKTILQPEEIRMTSYGAEFFSKRFAEVPLKPGRYRISVESLTDVPELIGTPVMLQIGRDPKAVPIGSTDSAGSLLGYLWSIVRDYLP